MKESRGVVKSRGSIRIALLRLGLRYSVVPLRLLQKQFPTKIVSESNNRSIDQSTNESMNQRIDQSMNQ